MILQLSKNITIEREENGKPIGDIVFKKADFALFVDITNLDVLNDSFNVVFRVIRKEDNRILEQVGSPVTIAKEGRDGSMSNTKAVNDYKAAKKKLQDEIKEARQSANAIQKELKPLRENLAKIHEEINTLRSDVFELKQKQNPTESDIAAIATKEAAIISKQADLKTADELVNNKSKEWSLKNNALVALEDDLLNLPEVLPIYEKIDKYDDIVGNKIDNNKLTEDGLTWIKGLPLLKSTLGEYVV